MLYFTGLGMFLRLLSWLRVFSSERFLQSECVTASSPAKHFVEKHIPPLKTLKCFLFFPVLQVPVIPYFYQSGFIPGTTRDLAPKVILRDIKADWMDLEVPHPTMVEVATNVVQYHLINVRKLTILVYHSKQYH